MRTMMLRVVALCAGIALAGGHGAMIHPKPRNAIDGQLPINDQGGCQRTAERPNYCYSCNCGCMGDGCLTKEGGAVGNWNGNCTPGTRAGMNGQPCLWFSQGCTIGCSECDNKTQQTVGKSLCGKVTKPTLPKRAWTVNRFAVEGSANDTCYQHPWRAPGSESPITGGFCLRIADKSGCCAQLPPSRIRVAWPEARRSSGRVRRCSQTTSGRSRARWAP